MKKRYLSSGYLSAFCLELSVMLHAGIGVGDGLHLLAEDRDQKSELLRELAGAVDGGEPLSAAMAATQAFPDYAVYLAGAGEQTGRQEEAFRALAAYYDTIERMGNRIRGALTYPAILLLMMLAVIVVLLAKVLPVFESVFARLGGQMTGLAGGLLALGGVLNRMPPGLCVVLALVPALVAAFSVSLPFRNWAGRFWQRRRGDRGIAGKVGAAQFAAALSMGMASGLPVEEALAMATSLHSENAAMERRYNDCRSRLDEGAGLAEALRQSGLLPPAFCRMLSLGIRSGSGDTVMAEISGRLQTDAERSVEETVSRVEPGIVIVSSLLVGGILLSVMLPLVRIMSAIG